MISLFHIFLPWGICMSNWYWAKTARLFSMPFRKKKVLQGLIIFSFISYSMLRISSWNFAYFIFDAMYSIHMTEMLQRQFDEKKSVRKKLNCSKALIILINCFIIHYEWWIVIFPLIQSIQNFRYILTVEVTTKKWNCFYIDRSQQRKEDCLHSVSMQTRTT